MLSPSATLNDLRSIHFQCAAKLSFPLLLFQEKRGHRESRLLENLDKMVLEATEQMQPTTLEGVNQQLSDVIKRCKFSLSHLRLFFKLC